MNPPPAEIGASIEEIETPALLLDLDAFERNIATMASFAARSGVRVRPHAKCHKSPAIALRQIASGAVGQCVQKVGEAEALVRGGIKDVLVSNEVVGERKLKRLASLAKDANIALCFDAPEQVDAASCVARDFGVELGALVEIEVGMERCGIAPGRDAALLALRIADAPNLKFRGLQAYHGSAQHLPGWQERAQAIAFATDSVNETLRALAAHNLGCEIIAGGGTGTFEFEAASGVYNELQVGSYLFMDTEYARIGDREGGRYTAFEHSLFVLASVMSIPASDRAIVLQRRKGPPLGAWARGHRGHRRVRRAWQDQARRAGATFEAGRKALAHPRPLRPDHQSPRLVRGRAQRTGRGALAHQRPRREHLTPCRARAAQSIDTVQ
jgi:D-serine deaminase-like pyridoxal phosphate-dependent protein